MHLEISFVQNRSDNQIAPRTVSRGLRMQLSYRKSLSWALAVASEMTIKRSSADCLVH